MAPAAALGIALLLLGLTTIWPGAIGWAALPPAMAYVLSLYLGGRSLDLGAGMLGGALLLMVELGALSLELRGAVRLRGPLIARRLGVLAALGLGTVLLSYLLLLLAETPLAGGVPLTAVGLAAAVGVVAMIARLTRR